MNKVDKIMTKIAVRAAIAKSDLAEKMEKTLNEKREGAFAFEYMIVLAMMVVVIAAAWGKLGSAITTKVGEIVTFLNSEKIKKGS